MLKILGAALLVLCGALGGLSRVRQAKDGLALLEELHAALGLMAGQIELCARPLPDILELLSRESGGQSAAFFAAAAECCALMPAGEAWRRCCGGLALADAEKRARAGLGSVLGCYGAEKQAAEIEALRRRLAEFAEGRRREIAEKQKGLPALGACLAAMAALLVM